MEWEDGNMTGWQDHNVGPSLLLISYTMYHHRRSESVVTHGKCSYIVIYGYVYCFYQYIQKYSIFLTEDILSNFYRMKPTDMVANGLFVYEKVYRNKKFLVTEGQN